MPIDGIPVESRLNGSGSGTEFTMAQGRMAGDRMARAELRRKDTA